MQGEGDALLSNLSPFPPLVSILLGDSVTGYLKGNCCILVRPTHYSLLVSLRYSPYMSCATCHLLCDTDWLEMGTWTLSFLVAMCRCAVFMVAFSARGYHPSQTASQPQLEAKEGVSCLETWWGFSVNRVSTGWTPACCWCCRWPASQQGIPLVGHGSWPAISGGA